MSLLEDLVPRKLLVKMKPDHNGRLEVTWRIYNALCHISQGYLSDDQRTLLKIETEAAYRRWELEGKLIDKDGLQGPKGFAAAKRQHLKSLKSLSK